MVGSYDQTLRSCRPRNPARLALGQARACQICCEAPHQEQSKALVGRQPPARSSWIEVECEGGGAIAIGHQVATDKPTIASRICAVVLLVPYRIQVWNPCVLS